MTRPDGVTLRRFRIRGYRASSFTSSKRTNLMFGRFTPVTTTRASGIPDIERPVKYPSLAVHLCSPGEAVQRAVEAAVATADHSDIRGSEPHNRDPSGAVSD